MLAVVVEREHPLSLGVVPLRLRLGGNEPVAVVGVRRDRLPSGKAIGCYSDALCEFELCPERRIATDAACEKGTLAEPSPWFRIRTALANGSH